MPDTLVLTLNRSDRKPPLITDDEATRFGVSPIFDIGPVDDGVEIDMEWPSGQPPQKAIVSFASASCPTEEVPVDVHGQCSVLVVPDDVNVVRFVFA